MSLDLEEYFKRLFSYKGKGNSPAARVLIDESALLYHFIKNMPSKTTEAAKKLENILRRSEAKTPLTRWLSKCLLSFLTNDKAEFNDAFNNLKKLHEEMDLIDRISDVINFEVHMFEEYAFYSGMIDEDQKDYIRRLYAENVKQIQKRLREENVALKKEFNANKRAVVLTIQLLGGTHGPSKSSLTIAKYLTQNHGFEVMIVNTLEPGPKVGGAMIPAKGLNVFDQYSGTSSISFGGSSYGIYQPPNREFSEDSIINCVTRIEEYDPSLIVSASMMNTVSELFDTGRFTMRYPTAKGLPYAVNCNFNMREDPTELEQKIIETHEMSDLYRYTLYPGFDLPAREDALDRSEYGIPEDAFVFAAVSTRLDNELTPDILDLFEEIITIPNAYIALAGIYAKPEKLYNLNPSLKGRVIYTGYQSQVMAFYSMCDAYINVSKKGGGGSIVYAMSAGLPPLALREGDAGQAMMEMPDYKDYAGILYMANLLVTDKTIYDAFVLKAMAAAQPLGSRAPYVDRIMQEYQAHVDNLSEA